MTSVFNARCNSCIRRCARRAGHYRRLQRFLQPVDCRQRSGKMAAHSLVRLFRDAAHQGADAVGAVGSGTQVHVLHTQYLIAQVGDSVVSAGAGYRRRVGLAAIRAQRLAQPHVVDAAGEEH